MDIEQADPTTLTPHPQNSRLHTKKQIRALSGAIKEFGFTQPIVVNGEGVILMGHARREAALELGLETVPVIRRPDLTEAQGRALVIADNRLHELGGWDVKALDTELRALMAAGIDLTLTGFDLHQPNVDRSVEGEDDLPPIPTKPICRPGDVWHLGPHRLWIGDNRDPTIIGQVMGHKPRLMVTDPPYGVNYDPAWRKEALGATGATGKVMNDHEADWTDVWRAYPVPAAYVWHAGTHAHVVAESLQAAGYKIREQIIWAKSQMVIGRGNYHHQHEPCFLVEQGKSKWIGPPMSSVWNLKHRKSGSGHGTQKPVEAMRRGMIQHSQPGTVVVDPFMGSGTTIIAATSCGRIAMGVEIDPVYGDTAAMRWLAYSGDVPKLMRQTDKGIVDVLAGVDKVASGLKEAEGEIA